MLTRRALLAAGLASLIPRPSRGADWIAAAGHALLFGTRADFDTALDRLRRRGKADVVPLLILALRFRIVWRQPLFAALQELTGHDATDWFDWMVWQERHPEVVPHPSFTAVKLETLSRIDRDFRDFLDFFQPPWRERNRMRIRLEEITWGGVGAKTGIPSLDRPAMISAGEAGYLRYDDLVFGAEIDGDARAYPLRIMGWHEMMNDVIGGVPVALAYCTLCGSGILFETRVAPRREPFVFGSSGLLYRSNKLMFDWQTDSLWNQFTGRPVVGPLADSEIELAVRPLAITEWRHWRRDHPRTTVLSLDTGHHRDYRSGVVYRDYFADPELMFPTAVRPGSGLAAKDYVYGIRRYGGAKAWPVAAFQGGRAINDSVAGLPVVLLGDAAGRTVRAYERGARQFAWREGTLHGPGGAWTATEAALVGPDGSRLPRVAGRLSYWFAWDGYYGARSALYKP